MAPESQMGSDAQSSGELTRLPIAGPTGTTLGRELSRPAPPALPEPRSWHCPREGRQRLGPHSLL